MSHSAKRSDISAEENGPILKLPKMGTVWSIVKILFTIALPLVAVCLLAWTGLKNTKKQMDEEKEMKSFMELFPINRELLHKIDEEQQTTCQALIEREHSQKAVDKHLQNVRQNTDTCLVKGIKNAIVDVRKTLTDLRNKVDMGNISCFNLTKGYLELQTMIIDELIFKIFELRKGRFWLGMYSTYLWALLGNNNIVRSSLIHKFDKTGQLTAEEHARFLQVSGAGEAIVHLFQRKVPSAVHNSLEGVQSLTTNLSQMVDAVYNKFDNLNHTNTTTIDWETYVKKHQKATDLPENRLFDYLKEHLKKEEERIYQENFWTLTISVLCLILCPLFGILYGFHVHSLDKLSIKSQKLWAEESKVSHLVHQLLPKVVANNFLRGKPVKPEVYHSVSILCSDIVGFTSLCAKSKPLEVVDLLNRFFIEYDTVLEAHDCHKIETIGDAYIVASGLPVRNDPAHSDELCTAALDTIQMCTTFTIPHMNEECIMLRIGIHTGPCVAGVVGLKTPRFCVFGETLNIASNMESGGAPMCVQLSESTASHIQMYHQTFQLRKRGRIQQMSEALKSVISTSEENGPTLKLPKIGTIWSVIKIVFTIGLPLIAVCLLAWTGLAWSEKQRNQVGQLENILNLIQSQRILLHKIGEEQQGSCQGLIERANSGKPMEEHMRRFRERTDALIAMVDLKKNITEIRKMIDAGQFSCFNLTKEFLNIQMVIIDDLIEKITQTSRAQFWLGMYSTYLWSLVENYNVLKSSLIHKFVEQGKLTSEEFAHFLQIIGASEATMKLFKQKVPPSVRNSLEGVQSTTVYSGDETNRKTSFNIEWEINIRNHEKFTHKPEHHLFEYLKEFLKNEEEQISREYFWTLTIAISCLVLCPLFGLLYGFHVYRLDKLSVKSQKLWEDEAKTSHLVYQMLPKAVAVKILSGKLVKPEVYQSVSLLCSDIVGFTSLCSKSRPLEVVDLLNRFFIEYDTVLEAHDCYKIETIGDAYIVASGLPVRNEPAHSDELCTTALDTIQMCNTFTIPHMNEESIMLRIGIHTGPCVAGVVGLKTPRFCVFGDTLNIASNMESGGAPSCVQLSEATANHIKLHHKSFKIWRKDGEKQGPTSSTISFWLLNKAGHSCVIDVAKAKETYEKSTYWRYVGRVNK